LMPERKLTLTIADRFISILSMVNEHLLLSIAKFILAVYPIKKSETGRLP